MQYIKYKWKELGATAIFASIILWFLLINISNSEFGVKTIASGLLFLFVIIWGIISIRRVKINKKLHSTMESQSKCSSNMNCAECHGISSTISSTDSNVS